MINVETPFINLEQCVARNFTFYIPIDLDMYHHMDVKILPKVVSWGQICKFWNLFSKFGTGVARNFKFVILVDLGTDDKITPKGVWSMGQILQFWDPFVNLIQVILEISNFVH